MGEIDSPCRAVAKHAAIRPLEPAPPPGLPEKRLERCKKCAFVPDSFRLVLLDMPDAIGEDDMIPR